MDIQFLVERLEALVVNARKLPMTSQVILEQAAILDLIDQMRVAIPEEVKQARRIVQESERLVQKAREEGEHIIGAAQEQGPSSCRISRSSARRSCASRIWRSTPRRRRMKRCAAPTSTRPTCSSDSR